MLDILTGSSRSSDPKRAVQELYEQIYQPSPSLVLFYCSTSYDLPSIEKAFRDRFAGKNVIGCTTAGEISSFGYTQNSLIGISISSPDFIVATECIQNLKSFKLRKGQLITESLLNALKKSGVTPTPDNTFGFMLIDGLSGSEEFVTASLHTFLDNIQLVGGSSGDDLKFERTHVYYQGAFRTDAALFSLIHTKHPFSVFKNEHLRRTAEELVVTEADINQRRVIEINGVPAAREYARLVHAEGIHALDSLVFSSFPLALNVEDELFVRSIQRVHEDESISFYCAIDEGMVLSLVEAGDLTLCLRNEMEDIKRSIGLPQLILGCDCTLRSLEIERKSLTEEIEELMSENNVFAFNTYGEQYNGLHVNQTFTGVAIGV